MGGGGNKSDRRRLEQTGSAVKHLKVKVGVKLFHLSLDNLTLFIELRRCTLDFKEFYIVKGISHDSRAVS